MKRTILFVALMAALAGGWVWLAHSPAAPRPAQGSGGRTILYYQSPMHPWIRSDKPGKCPICGMNLVPIYADAETSNTGNGLKLDADSVTAADIRTAPVASRRITHTVRVAGTIQSDGPSSRFKFTAYQYDLAWLEPGQTVVLALPSILGKVFQAVTLPGDWSISRTNPIASPTGISISAEVSASPGKGDAAKNSPAPNGAYAEGRVEVQTPQLLTVPRGAVLSPDEQPLVYVATAGNRYEPRKITLGRVGDDFAEVVSGLKEGEVVVTSGSLVIDAEAQISRDASQKASLP